VYRTERRPGDDTILLQNRDEPYNRFFTTLDKSIDEPEAYYPFLQNGVRAYNILGYANGTADAQTQLYGRTF
jgi:hypothetical protein